MNGVIERISEIGIMPVVKINDAETSVILMKTHFNGGLQCAEISFRTNRTEECIRRITKELPHMMVGAGSVMTVENVKNVVAAGASFVSSRLNHEIIGYCLKNGIPVIPECESPSDIESALRYGLETVDIFPSEAEGGNMLEALAASCCKAEFMFSSAIIRKIMKEYLVFDKVITCGKSLMET